MFKTIFNSMYREDGWPWPATLGDRCIAVTTYKTRCALPAQKHRDLCGLHYRKSGQHQGPRFDGRTYVHSRDGERLAKQLETVKAIMLDGEPHTLAELAEKAHASTASVSARIRDLRKERFGGYQIDRDYLHDGVWEYRMVTP